MKFSRQLITVLLVCVSFIFTSSVFAQTGGDYNTPDSWSKHQTVNGTKFTMDGMSVGAGTLKLGLSSRYSGKFFKDTDQIFYQYLRGYLSDVELGSGTMRVALNMRAAKDIDGLILHDSSKYYFNPTILDHQANYDGDYWDFRIYDANVVLDNVLNYTKLTAGRFRVNYLSEYKFDGAELYGGTDNYNAYVYYGLPVSYYQYLNTTAIGGGLNLHFADDMFILRAEAASFSGGRDDDTDPRGVDTMTWKARADLNLELGDAVAIAPYAEIGAIEEAMVFEAGVYANIAVTGTSLDLWVCGQSDYNIDPVNSALAYYSNLMASDDEYTQFGVSIYQGLLEYFVVGLGLETRMNGEDAYANRDYMRIMGNLDFFGVIPGNYFSISLDYYDVAENNELSAEQRMFVGGRITQNISPNAAVWLGASMVNYSYDDHPIDIKKIARPGELGNGYKNKTQDNSVYVAYLGGQWKINDIFTVTADYTYEMSDVIGSVDSENDTINYAELWLNVSF